MRPARSWVISPVSVPRMSSLGSLLSGFPGRACDSVLLEGPLESPAGNCNGRGTSSPGDRPLCFHPGGNLLPFPARAVTLLLLLLLPSQQPPLLPAPSPQPRAGCQEAESHSGARELGPQEERQVWSSSSCHVQRRGRHCRGSRQPPGSINGGRAERTD